METLPKHGRRAPVKEYLRTQCLINMCTSCDMTCANDGFASIYPLAQADLAQLVEHNLAKVGVAGSSPVVRSSESSSAVSPGEAALFVVVATRDQAITRPATPQTNARSLVSAPSPSRVPARTRPQYTQKPGRPGLQGKLAARAARTLCQSHRRLGKLLVPRRYFVTMTETSSLMVL